jgi:hypothetical protein
MSRKVPAKQDGGEATTLAKSYEPTPHDRKVMQAYFEEQRENPPPPRLKAVRENSGTLSLAPDHPDIFVGVVPAPRRHWSEGSEPR